MPPCHKSNEAIAFLCCIGFKPYATEKIVAIT